MSGDAPLVGIPEDMPRLLESDPDLPDELIDRILDGQPVDASAPLEAHLLAEWVATLRSAAQQSELRGEPSAVAAFLWAKRSSPGRGSSQRQLHPSVRKGIAGAAIVGAISAGGVVAAATGSLPAPLQVVAHVLFGAHPPPADDSGGDEPTGSDFASPLPADVLKPIPNQPSSVGTSDAECILRTRPPVSPTCGPRQTRWPLQRRTHTAQPASPRPLPPTRHRRRRSRRVGRRPAWSRGVGRRSRRVGRRPAWSRRVGRRSRRVGRRPAWSRGVRRRSRRMGRRQLRLICPKLRPGRSSNLARSEHSGPDHLVASRSAPASGIGSQDGRLRASYTAS